MLWNFFIYLFSSRKKTYKYLARCYNVSAFRVCALDHGKKARTGKDYMISCELERLRRPVSRYR